MTDPANVLTTPRLQLTPLSLADFDESAAMWSDPEVMRHMGGAGVARSAAWSRFLGQAGSWSLLGYGTWIIRDRDGGRFVGEVGFFDMKRELTPAFTDPEAGWVMATWAHGKGLAAEAVSAAHAWADARFKGPRTVCIIDPGNTPSLRLAARAGYVVYGASTFRDREVVLLERPTPLGKSR